MVVPKPGLGEGAAGRASLSKRSAYAVLYAVPHKKINYFSAMTNISKSSVVNLSFLLNAPNFAP